MRHPRRIVFGLLLGLASAGNGRLSAQLPLASPGKSGRTVTPAFEGWYSNKDGTYSLSFGYYNRNSEEPIDVPIGPDNFVSPGDRNQGQPTRFERGRHWGVFAVRVPADFGDKTVTWTLTSRGETFAIPGRLHANWQIDALEGEAGSGNTPPALRFVDGGPEGSGPLGITSAVLRGTAGVPIALEVWARDDGRAASGVSRAGQEAVPVTLTWFKHQGAGSVSFEPPTARVAVTGASAKTLATFSEPGDFVVRVRANDASGVAGAGHAQCCWTNGFIRVVVAP